MQRFLFAKLINQMRILPDEKPSVRSLIIRMKECVTEPKIPSLSGRKMTAPKRVNKEMDDLPGNYAIVCRLTYFLMRI